MAHWLYPANTKFYDVLGALNEPVAYWPINSKVESGDIIYYYLAAPYKQIGYIGEVKSVGHSVDSVMDKVRPFFKQEPKGDAPDKLFMEVHVFRRMELTPDSAFGLSALRDNGLNGMLMGPRKLENNPSLLDYLKEAEGGLS